MMIQVEYSIGSIAGVRYPQNSSFEPLLDKVWDYFVDHPEVLEDWEGYYLQITTSFAKLSNARIK
jgi:hypothetical protein